MPAPFDRGDDCRQRDPPAQCRDSRFENAVVAVDDAFETAFAAILAGAPAAGERANADVARVGRVETAYELLGERSFAREASTARPAGQKLGKAAVALASSRQLSHHAVELGPEVVDTAQCAVA